MKVAILGAGAIGMPLGYMLRNRERNEVTYLVRRKKVRSMTGETVKLFSYDSRKLIEYSDLKFLETELLLEEFDRNTVVENPFADFDVIVVTLPTDVLQAEAGKNLIRGLAQRVKTECVFVCLSPGYGMYEKVFGQVGLQKKRIVYGLPLFLSHEVPMQGQPEHEKFKDREGAQLAFHYLISRSRIMLLSTKPRPLKNALRAAKTGSISAGEKMLEAATAMFLILNLLLNLQDYPSSLRRRDPSFRTAMGAFNQIMRQYGALGATYRLFVGKTMIKATDYFNRKFSKPLTIDFIKYHHGKKVMQQNLEVIALYIEAGEAKKRDVSKIQAFVDLFKDPEEVLTSA